MWTKLKNEDRKAKKEHTCNFCLCKIEKGTEYNYSAYKLDADFYDWKAHHHCFDIVSKLNMQEHSEYGVTDEDFQITIREEYKNLMSLYNSEIYEYEHFVYPDFEGQLKYVCEMHKVEFPC